MKAEILGASMQSLHIILEEGEKVYSDSGKLVSKSSNIEMTPRLIGGILGAISRQATGATGMLTEFKSKKGESSVVVAGVMPGKIKEIILEKGDQFVAEKYAFLAAEETVKFTMQAVPITAAMFGGTGLLLQKFTGPGKVYIHVVGDIIEHVVSEGENFEVDPGHIAGFDGNLSYNIKFVDNIRTMLFGGVGLFLAAFKGNGKIILHSVSRHKLSSEIYLTGLAQEQKKGKK